MAYVVVVVRSRLAAMDESLEEAAMDLGGRPLAVFFDITVPMLLPALVSGWLLAFTLSLDDLVISSFVSGPGATTLPMLIFAKVRLGVTPDINAITTIIIALVIVAVATAVAHFEPPSAGGGVMASTSARGYSRQLARRSRVAGRRCIATRNSMRRRSARSS